MYLCREAAEKELRSIGEAFGVTYSAVSIANRRVRTHMRESKAFRKDVERVRGALLNKLKT